MWDIVIGLEADCVHVKASESVFINDLMQFMQDFRNWLKAL